MLDIDVLEHWHEWLKEHGRYEEWLEFAKAVVTVKTASGGLHYYFRYGPALAGVKEPFSIGSGSLTTVHSVEAFGVGDTTMADLSQLSDADRRVLARAALTRARAVQLNALTSVTVKVPPNCYDTSGAGYDAAACRISRNQRDAEIEKRS